MSFDGSMLLTIVLMYAVGCIGCWCILRFVTTPQFVARHPWAEQVKTRVAQVKERIFPTLEADTDECAVEQTAESRVGNESEDDIVDGTATNHSTSDLVPSPESRKLALQSRPCLDVVPVGSGEPTYRSPATTLEFAAAQAGDTRRPSGAVAEESIEPNHRRQHESISEEADSTHFAVKNIQESSTESVRRILQNADDEAEAVEISKEIQNPNQLAAPSRSGTNVNEPETNVSVVPVSQSDVTSKRTRVELESANDVHTTATFGKLQTANAADRMSSFSAVESQSISQERTVSAIDGQGDPQNDNLRGTAVTMNATPDVAGRSLDPQQDQTISTHRGGVAAREDKKLGQPLPIPSAATLPTNAKTQYSSASETGADDGKRERDLTGSNGTGVDARWKPTSFASVASAADRVDSKIPLANSAEQDPLQSQRLNSDAANPRPTTNAALRSHDDTAETGPLETSQGVANSEKATNADKQALFGAGRRPSQLALSDRKSLDELAEKAGHRLRNFRESFCFILYEVDALGPSATPVHRDDLKQVSEWFHMRICQGMTNSSDPAVISVQGAQLIALVPRTDLDDGKRLAEKVRRSFVRAPYKLDDQLVPVTVCAGVAAANTADDVSTEEVLKRAELALAAAKQGRNQVYFHDGERCRPLWRTGGSQCDQESPETADTMPESLSEELVNAGWSGRSSQVFSFDGWSSDGRARESTDAEFDEAEWNELEDEAPAHSEKRLAARSVLGQMIPIAPYSDGITPEPGDFRPFLCRDISLTGFSFYARPAPNWSHLVVKLLGKSLIAKIVHRTRAVMEGRDNSFIVGCCFVGQMDLSDGRTSTMKPHQPTAGLPASE